MQALRACRGFGRWSTGATTAPQRCPRRSFASHGSDADYNEPSGRLFPECYDENGVKQRQGWETVTYATYGLTFVLLVFGLSNKPESRTLQRERRKP